MLVPGEEVMKFIHIDWEEVLPVLPAAERTTFLGILDRNTFGGTVDNVDPQARRDLIASVADRFSIG